MLFIIYLMWINISDSNYEKWSKEQDIKRKQEQNEKDRAELDNELQCVNDAFLLLPNVDEAIRKLLKKYNAKAILHSLYLSISDIRLLMQLDADKWTSVELPNMQSENYSNRERRALHKARETIKNRRPFFTENDFLEEVMTYGIDSVIQEPTVGRLYQLQRYLEFKSHLDKGKNIKCKLTPDGDALVKFYFKLYVKEDPNLISFPKSETKKEISRFAKTAMELIKSNN
ncbi:hypothetical protein [Methylomonas rosea]|uniref:WYL domain-containing protein n=1 Tax=Methylomonas rosea TaxID=2952227 RepID=A0ABT1TXY5_9GAMM|nr:hypothetical protein [Methylomonas sp. WSC-7]MCQ8119629.1 hypothetical protein [Methylomonas sp. WSC-7]